MAMKRELEGLRSNPYFAMADSLFGRSFQAMSDTVRILLSTFVRAEVPKTHRSVQSCLPANFLSHEETPAPRILQFLLFLLSIGRSKAVVNAVIPIYGAVISVCDTSLAHGLVLTSLPSQGHPPSWERFEVPRPDSGMGRGRSPLQFRSD